MFLLDWVGWPLRALRVNFREILSMCRRLLILILDNRVKFLQSYRRFSAGRICLQDWILSNYFPTDPASATRDAAEHAWISLHLQVFCPPLVVDQISGEVKYNQHIIHGYDDEGEVAKGWNRHQSWEAIWEEGSGCGRRGGKDCFVSSPEGVSHSSS